MQDANHMLLCRAHNERTGVVLGVARVHDDGAMELGGEGQLCLEGTPLLRTGRVVVVIVEPAFADRAGAADDMLRDARKVPCRVEAAGIVRMHASSEIHELRMGRRELLCAVS